MVAVTGTGSGLDIDGLVGKPSGGRAGTLQESRLKCA
jgi:hypothetical protein